MFTPTVASIFAGCGGLDVGFLEQGFSLRYACDNDPAAVDCYTRNLGEPAALRDVRSDDFHRDVRSLRGVDVVLGGFPCQGFSKAGPKREDDDRNLLYREMLRVVAEVRPRVVVAENVDGISQNFGGGFLDRIHQDFQAIGYRLASKILDACTFGLPQFRRRVFFVGTPADDAHEFVWPEPQFVHAGRNGEFRIAFDTPLFDQRLSGAAGSPNTIRDAISDLVLLDPSVPDHDVVKNWPASYETVFRAIGPGQKLCNVRHAPSSVHTWEIPEMFGETTARERRILDVISTNRRHKKYGRVPNGNPLAIDVIEILAGLAQIEGDIASLLSAGYLKRVGDKFDLKGAMFCSGLFKRPLWDEPAPTVLTNFHSPRYFLHPLANRPFSLRECARLQGFDDAFLFTGHGSSVTLLDGYRLVGNAVPPPLSRVMASSVRRHLEAARQHCVA